MLPTTYLSCAGGEEQPQSFLLDIPYASFMGLAFTKYIFGTASFNELRGSEVSVLRYQVSFVYFLPLLIPLEGSA